MRNSPRCLVVICGMLMPWDLLCSSTGTNWDPAWSDRDAVRQLARCPFMGAWAICAHDSTEVVPRRKELSGGGSWGLRVQGEVCNWGFPWQEAWGSCQGERGRWMQGEGQKMPGRGGRRRHQLQPTSPQELVLGMVSLLIFLGWKTSILLEEKTAL